MKELRPNTKSMRGEVSATTLAIIARLKMPYRSLAEIARQMSVTRERVRIIKSRVQSGYWK